MTPAHSPCARKFPGKLNISTYLFQHPSNCFAPSTPPFDCPSFNYQRISTAFACSNCRAAWRLDTHTYTHTDTDTDTPTSHVRAIPFRRQIAYKTIDLRDHRQTAFHQLHSALRPLLPLFQARIALHCISVLVDLKAAPSPQPAIYNEPCTPQAPDAFNRKGFPSCYCCATFKRSCLIRNYAFSSYSKLAKPVVASILRHVRAHASPEQHVPIAR